MFDLENFKWNKPQAQGTAPDARSFHAYTLIDVRKVTQGKPKMAIFGGYTERGFTNDLFLYDLIEQKWEKPIVLYEKNADLPTSRQGASLFYALERLWLFGGFSSGVYYNNMYSYELSTSTWKDITSEI